MLLAVYMGSVSQYWRSSKTCPGQWLSLSNVRKAHITASALSSSNEIYFLAGPGLVFTVYSVGLSLLPSPKVWSCLFFITLFLVGVDSQVRINLQRST